MVPKCRVGLPIGGQNAPQDPPKISHACPPGASWRPLKSDQHATSALDGFWSAFLVPLGIILAPSWLYLGLSWPQFVPSWPQLGPLNPIVAPFGGTTWKQAPCRNLGRPTCQKLLQHCPQLLHLAFQGNWPRTCQEHGKNQRQRTATCQLSSVMLPPRCDRQRKERPAPERGAAVLPPYGGFN